MIITYPNDTKVTLYSQDKLEENFPNDKKGRYCLKYQGTSYRIRNAVLDYSDYLLQCFETNLNTCEINLEFKYATSIKAYNTVMKKLLVSRMFLFQMMNTFKFLPSLKN